MRRKDVGEVVWGKVGHGGKLDVSRENFSKIKMLVIITAFNSYVLLGTVPRW